MVRILGVESRLAATVCSPPGIVENENVTGDAEYRNLHPVVAELPAHKKVVLIETPSRGDRGTAGIVPHGLGPDDKPDRGRRSESELKSHEIALRRPGADQLLVGRWKTVPGHEHEIQSRCKRVNMNSMLII